MLYIDNVVLLVIGLIMLILDFAKQLKLCYQDIENKLILIVRDLGFSLNLSQLNLLYNINQYGVPSPTRSDRSSLSHNLNKLVGMKLISRYSDVATDRRRVRFYLTDQGKNLLAFVAREESKYFDRFFYDHFIKTIQNYGGNNVK